MIFFHSKVHLSFRSYLSKCTCVTLLFYTLKWLIVGLLVMGIGWVFGLLTIENDIVAFQYLFGVFAGLQGFFIFVFHVWRDPLVWTAYSVHYGTEREESRFDL
jgi:hypothetical protein